MSRRLGPDGPDMTCIALSVAIRSRSTATRLQSTALCLLMSVFSHAKNDKKKVKMMHQKSKFPLTYIPEVSCQVSIPINLYVLCASVKIPRPRKNGFFVRMLETLLQLSRSSRCLTEGRSSACSSFCQMKWRTARQAWRRLAEKCTHLYVFIHIQ